MYKYNDIIEYIDETNDLNFNNAQMWAVANNASLIEQVGKRKNQNGLLYRYFIIRENVKLPEPTPPTDEEIRQMRERAYESEVDPITAHIQRLRDTTPMTEEVEIEIAELIAERDAKVAAIKERYPYNEGGE